MTTILVSTLTFVLEPNSTPLNSIDTINQTLCLWACACTLYPYVCGGTHAHMFFVEDRRDSANVCFFFLTYF